MTNAFDLIPRPNVAQAGKPAVQTQHQIADNISLPTGFNVDAPTKSIEKAPLLTLANRVKERRSPTVRLFQLPHSFNFFIPSNVKREGRRFIPLADSDDEEEEEAF